jgi:hypothetical protein
MARYISRKILNAEVKEYLKIQEKAKANKCFDQLNQDIEDEKKAHNFYNVANEISFVFEKEWIQFLLSKPGTTHLRVYYGAQSDGKPTIILVSAKKINPYVNIFLDDEDGGVEWPEGLGTSSNPGNFDVSLDNV